MSSHGWPHGAYIRAHREALGLSQPALARAARITPAMINRLESGHRRGRPALLRAVADALEVPASELLDRAGYTAEAQYWQTQETAGQAPDPLIRFQSAVDALRLHPSLHQPLRTLVAALVRDREPEFRRRFDAAVTRYPGRTDADTARFTQLRALLFGTEPAGPTGDREGP